MALHVTAWNPNSRDRCQRSMPAKIRISSFGIDHKPAVGAFVDVPTLMVAQIFREPALPKVA